MASTLVGVLLTTSLALTGRAGRVRAGYAIHAQYVVPTSVLPATKMPDVLVALNATAFPSLSRARKALRRGAVIVNGQEVRCISRAGPGDVVELQQRVMPGFAPRGVPPFPVRVLFEDTHLAVVHKPAGVVTHPPPGGASGSRSMRTAVQYALQPPPAGTAGALYRPHCCHRLDKPTSGTRTHARSRAQASSPSCSPALSPTPIPTLRFDARREDQARRDTAARRLP